MRSDTRTITIDARPEDVFAIVAEAVAHARILANEDGTEVVFRQFQADAPVNVFDAQAEAVTRELVVLKVLAETECPL